MLTKLKNYMAEKKPKTPKETPAPKPDLPKEPKDPFETPINLDELANLSGETTVKQVKYIVPVLKFNGNTGEFAILVPDSEGKYAPEPKGRTAEGVVLKIRRTFTAFEKIPGGSIRFFTNEHNSYKDNLTLFERSKDDRKPRMIEEGSIKKIRADYPNLRLRQNLYFLYNDGVVKLGVRGKSLSSLFDYYKEFGPKEHLFQFVTKITSHKEESEGGIDYFVMDFKRGPESDLPVVADKIKEVSENLAIQDKAYQEMPVMEEAKEEIQKEEIPVLEEEKAETNQETPAKTGEEENEIKVEDIPL